MNEEADLDWERKIGGSPLYFNAKLVQKCSSRGLRVRLNLTIEFLLKNLDILRPKTGLNAAEMPYFVAVKSKPLHVRNVENYTHSH